MRKPTRFEAALVTICLLGLSFSGLIGSGAFSNGPEHRPATQADATSHIYYGNGFMVTDQFPIGDSAIADFFFNRAASYGVGSNTSSNPISNGYATTPCLQYTSEAQFVSDVSGGVIPNATWPAGSCVFYDTENWTQTPTNEQQDPESYMPAFNQEAVTNGFVPWDSPALDLGNADTTCTKSGHGGTNVLWYENCHIAQYAVTNQPTMAPFGGVVVQNQSQIGTETAYVTLYRDAESDVDSTSPSSYTLSHVSDSYSTASQAVTDLNNIGQGNCDGVYITDTNSDASSTEGYSDAFFEDLKASSVNW